MYKLLPALIGVLISLMVLVNGRLAGTAGNIGASVIIHGSGMIAILIFLIAKKRKVPFLKTIPWYLYTGGFIGIVTILSNNAAFMALGVSITLSLGLLGQILASLIVDHYGLFGMTRQPFTLNRIGVIALIGAGIACMMFL